MSFIINYEPHGYLAVSGSYKLISVTSQTRHNPVIVVGSQALCPLPKENHLPFPLRGQEVDRAHLGH